MKFSRCHMLLTGLALATTAAFMGILSGPQKNDGTAGPYTPALILQDVGMTILASFLAHVLIRSMEFLVDKSWATTADARKIQHILSGPCFVMLWPFFSSALGSKYFALIVPFVSGFNLILLSQESVDNDSDSVDHDAEARRSVVKTMSRSGRADEVMGGPFFYCCILATCIVLFWRDCPEGVVGISMLAGGDGLADLVGRRYGKSNQWPIPGLQKSMVGSLAFCIAGTAISLLMLSWMQFMGCFHLDPTFADLVTRVQFVGLVSAAFELWPVLDDNIMVFASAAIMTQRVLALED